MSAVTFSLTMDALKSEEQGYNQWQGQRNPLPMPLRMPTSYDGQPPTSSLVLPYHGGAPSRNSYLPISAELPRDLSASQPRLQATKGPALTSHYSYPSLKRQYHSLDEGVYSESVPETYDGGVEPEASTSATINPDHRLLSFGRLPDRHTILDRHGRTRMMEISAQIHGMFFLSEIATSSGEGVIIQPELTCYRRNLFQISGSVTGPTGPLSVLNERGEAIPIVTQELSISAMESVDKHVIRLVVIPWKTPQPGSPEIPPNHEQEPLPIPIFQPADGGQSINSDMTVQSIAWRRLQFRVATANNGRRKELQQHFNLRLTLNATLTTGAKLCIGECSTAPIVVRGRSPRNFQARKEIPLSNSGSVPRAQTLQSAATERRSPLSSVPDKFRGPPPMSLDMPKRPFQFDTSNFPASPPIIRNSYSQWNTNQQPGHQAAIPASGYPPQTPNANSSQYSHVISPHAEVPPSNTPPVMSPIPNSDTMNRSEFYHPSSAAAPSMPHRYVDNNPRPTKSPRHVLPPDVNAQPPYPAFESRLGSSYVTPQVGQQVLPPREYFPAAVLSEPWTASTQNHVLYQTSMPPPQQFNYTSEPYVKDEPQQTHYTWGT